MSIAFDQMLDQGWRLNNLYWIIDKQGNKIKFRMNWAQQDLFEGLWFKDLILKARQLGMSTFIQLLMLDTCLFTDNTACGVIAHTDDAAKLLFRRNIKTPYENLPEGVRQARPTIEDSAHNYRFNNGSSIVVATSIRSGTYQIVHVSEFGKICAKFPERAREIVTGSLKAVAQGGLSFIESTAEGAEGYFYTYCQKAKALRDAGKKLTLKDWKFFFYPWWKHPEYRMNPAGVVISPELEKYFAEVQEEIGTSLSAGQRAWYAKELEETGTHEDMMREHPSTPDEAFKMSIEGSYYSQQITAARRQERITSVPIEPSLPINTFWDLGIDDFTAIWLHQQYGREHRFVRYIEGNGEALQYYANLLWDIRRDYGVTFGTHYFPHDVRVRSLKDGKALIETAEKLGLTPNVIVDTPDLLGGITSVRNILGSCWFDETHCTTGLSRLELYRRDWNERLSAFRSTPRHDDNSHGADAFRMFAQGYQPPFTYEQTSKSEPEPEEVY